MKNFLSSVIIIFLTLHTCQANAQQGSIAVSGKILSADERQPVPGVSISIFRKGVGTATNAGGLFALIIPMANLSDTLRVSCIGFKTQQIPIINLKNGQTLNISLEKNSTELKEVSIEYHDALKIIQKAIRRIPDNYIDHPHTIRGFYRMYTYNGAIPLQLSEAVFDVYNFGYADKRADLFKLIKARNEKNELDFGTMEIGQKPNSVFEDDVVNHILASGFLNDAGLQKHEFEVKGTVDIKGYEAYQIEFKEKTGTPGRSFRGRMFIDTKTYAFIYFDYGLSPNGLKDLGDGKFAERAVVRTGDADVDLVQDHSEIGYQEVGHKWVLLEVKGEDALLIKDATQKADYVAHIKFNYQVTAVDTTQKASFSAKIGRNENINNYDSDGGEKFWKDYNILLSDFSTDDIFKQIQAINKTAKQKK